MSERQPGDLSRLDDLESRLAFQDDLIESLNAVVARQDRELVKLARRVKDLEAKLADLAEQVSLPGESGGHEVPPHY
jgi:SlyX protein